MIEAEANGLQRLHNHIGDYVNIPIQVNRDFQTNIRGMNIASRAKDNLLYDADGDEARELLRNTPEYRGLEAKYQSHKNAAVEGLSPLFDEYAAKYKPKEPDADKTRTKTIQNVMQLTPDVIDRAKAAGVPIWGLAGLGAGAGALGAGAPEPGPEPDTGMADGGIVDHVTLARHLMGEGGEVKAVTSLGKLVQEFLEHYTNFSHTPEHQLTDDQLNHVQSLASQIQAQGVDPLSLLTRSVQLMGPEDSMHADGGRILSAEDPGARSSLATITDWVRTHMPKDRLDPSDPDYFDAPAAAARVTKSFLQPFYGQDPHGDIRFLGGSPRINIDTGEVHLGHPAAVDEARSMIDSAGHGLNWLADKIHGQSGKTLSTEITGDQPVRLRQDYRNLRRLWGERPESAHRIPLLSI